MAQKTITSKNAKGGDMEITGDLKGGLICWKCPARGAWQITIIAAHKTVHGTRHIRTKVEAVGVRNALLETGLDWGQETVAGMAEAAGVTEREVYDRVRAVLYPA